MDRGEQDTFEWRLNLTTAVPSRGGADPGNSEWCGWRERTDQRSNVAGRTEDDLAKP